MMNAIGGISPATLSYTPTLTNVANVAASTAYLCYCARVGDVVIVFGKVDIDPTLTNTLTQIDLSLPIASNFAAEEDCGGMFSAGTVAGSEGRVYANTTDDRMRLEFVPTDVANRSFSFIAGYRVI